MGYSLDLDVEDREIFNGLSSDERWYVENGCGHRELGNEYQFWDTYSDLIEWDMDKDINTVPVSNLPEFLRRLEENGHNSKEHRVYQMVKFAIEHNLTLSYS